jgi:hypothetical protein
MGRKYMEMSIIYKFINVKKDEIEGGYLTCE